MFAKLNDNEKNMISEYIERYAPGEVSPSAGSRADLETVLRPWAEAKADLFKLFGEKFIINRPVEYPADMDELENKVWKEMARRNTALSLFKYNFYEALEKYPELVPQRYGLMELIRPFYLATNKFDYDTIVIKDPTTGKDFKIPYGCKPVKMLGKLAKMFNIPGYEEFRVELSMITNQKNLHGNLCLSIHPLDYMTMSDNDYDWESCMSWKQTGCYRQGTVEMMNSPYVIVAYLRGDTDMHLFNSNDDALWSNKKWRELFIVHDDVISEIKGYPYQSTVLVDKVLEWLRELKEAKDVEYDSNIYENYGNDRNIKNPDGENIRLEFWTHNMYNDFGTMDRGHHCLIATDRIDKYLSLCYSGVSECMWCGDTNPNLANEESLVCQDCDCTCTCGNCGSHGWNEDDFIEVDGVWLCPDCYDDSVRMDNIHSEYDGDDEVHLESNMATITLSHFDDETPAFEWYDSSIYVYDDWDYHTDDFNQFFVNGVDSIKNCENRWGRVRYYVLPCDLTEKGWKIFGLGDSSDRTEYFDEKYREYLKKEALWF